MTSHSVTVRLPAELARAAQDMAREADVTPGQILRDLLAREIARRHRARPPVRADERLVAPLRARLAGDLAHAPTWADLQRRLRRQGYELREAGGGLSLYRFPCGTRLCKASELGFSYARLLRRIGAPFPAHAHRYLVARDDPDDDPVLFEPVD